MQCVDMNVTCISIFNWNGYRGDHFIPCSLDILGMLKVLQNPVFEYYCPPCTSMIHGYTVLNRFVSKSLGILLFIFRVSICLPDFMALHPMYRVYSKIQKNCLAKNLFYVHFMTFGFILSEIIFEHSCINTQFGSIQL